MPNLIVGIIIGGFGVTLFMAGCTWLVFKSLGG